MAELNINLTGSGGLAGTLSQDIYKDTPDAHLNYSTSDDEMTTGMYNPLMKNGYLHPSNNSFLTLNVPTISDEFMCALSDVNTGILFANQDDNIYTFEDSFVDGGITYTYKDLDGVKIATGVDFINYASDMVKYQVNSVQKIFYLASSGTANVGIASTSLASPDDDWLSTVCSGGTVLNSTGLNAFFVKADNGLLYVFDDYSVHSIDGKATGGANGTAEMNILTFSEALHTIVDAADDKGRLFIAINDHSTAHNESDDKAYDKLYVNTCGVYVWNRISSSVSMQDFITVEYCSRINRIWVGPNGELLLMTIGTNGSNQIRLFDGGKFVIIKELPFETKTSRRGSLLVAEGVTFWAGVDGYLYMGKFEANRFKVFQLAQYFDGTLQSSSGPILAFAGADSFTADTGYRTVRPHLVIGYRPNGASAVMKKYYIYGIDSMEDTNGSDSSGFITTPHNFVANKGDVKTGVKLIPTLSTIRTINIIGRPTETTDGTTIATVKIYFNMSTTAFKTVTITNTDMSKGYIEIPINKQNVSAVQLEVEWSITETMGVDTFCPIYAQVDYDPMKTAGGKTT